MKKNKLIFLTIIAIFVGTFGVHQNVFAACNNQFGEKKFGDTISVDRREAKPKFAIDFTYKTTASHPDCQGVVIPENFYDLYVSVTTTGWDSWNDTSIPDSAVKLKAGVTSRLSGTPSIVFSPDAIYEVRFKEEVELPDIESKKVLTWIDTVNIDTPTIPANKITASGAEFETTVIFNNKAAQLANKTVPQSNIVAKIYKADNTFVKEVPLTNTAPTTYGTEGTVTAKATGLSANTDYYVIFSDKNRYNVSSISKPFKTKASQTPKPTPTPTNPNNNTSTATGIDANGRNISVSFSFGNTTLDDVTKTATISGEMTYSRDLTDAEIQYKTVNKIFAYVYNSTGTVLTSSSGTVTKVSNKKLNFSKVFSGIDITKVDKFIIKDTDFSIASDLFSFNRTNAGGSANLSSAYSAVPATKNGTTVNLADPEIVTALSTSTSVNVKGTATYSNNSKTGTVSVADNKIILNLYTVDNQNSLTFNNSVPVPVTTANYNQPVNFSVNVITSDQTKKYAVQFVESNYNNAKSSAKVIEYKDGKFAAALNQPANNQNNNNGNNPPAGSTGGRGVLKPYLKPGLDTIPGIVTVLVDDIVIPIAVPLLAIAIMYTGFLFVRARGNSTKLEEAKRALKWTLLGGAIILGAYVIATALQATISDIVK